MSNQSCSSGSCGSSGKHSSCSCGSCGQKSHSCGCGCQCGSCSCNSCKCSCHGNEHCSFAHELLEMADEAWMCLLKDKIKQKIEKSGGAKLDELAEIVASSNHARWSEKMKAKDACEDYEDRIADFFSKHS